MQVTKCENTFLSNPKPQGSTLVPLLFILYVNHLYHVKHIFNIGLKMYADDTVINVSRRGEWVLRAGFSVDWVL